MSDPNQAEDDDLSYLRPYLGTPSDDEDIGYLFTGHKKATDEEKQKLEASQAHQNALMGAQAGAAAAGAGYATRQAATQAVDWLKQQAQDIIRGGDSGSNAQSPGGKWFSKVIGDQNYAPPEGDMSVKEAAQSYNSQKSRGKVSSKLEKKFGSLTPGKLSIQSTEAFPAQAPEAPVRTPFIQTPGGRLISTMSSLVPRFAGDVAYGAMHGLNAVNQWQQAAESQDPLSSALHGTSAVGSGLDILSSVAPTALRSGVRQIAGPLSVGAMSLGDYYDEMKNQQYNKAMATALAAPTFLNPVTAPLGATILYLKEHPKEAAKVGKAFSQPSVWGSSRLGLD